MWARRAATAVTQLLVHACDDVDFFLVNFVLGSVEKHVIITNSIGINWDFKVMMSGYDFCCGRMWHGYALFRTQKSVIHSHWLDWKFVEFFFLNNFCFSSFTAIVGALRMFSIKAWAIASHDGGETASGCTKRGLQWSRSTKGAEKSLRTS